MVRFLLNGKPASEDGAPPTMTVLDWLRTRARLTGTKEGCAEGDCGACTIVLGRRVDGSLQYQAVNSCLMMLPQIDDLRRAHGRGSGGADGALHPVQQALVDADATQCGFCTPGFVMAMFAFHHGGEPADDALIHEALAGNLCRCTGYRSIVEACRRIAHGPADRFVAEAAATAGGACRRCRRARIIAHGAQTFLMPRSLDALFAAMAQFPDAILLAGGTDLGLRVSKDREALPAVISIAGGRGAAADHERRRRARARRRRHLYRGAARISIRHFPSFGALVRRIGSRQIRNLGTIAGNLATASPIGDTLPCLIALDATVTLASRAGERTLPVEELHHRLSQDRAGAGRDHRGDPHSVARARPGVLPPTSCPSASIRTSRPSSRRSASTRQDGKVARAAGGLWRHGGARDAGREPRGSA